MRRNRKRKMKVYAVDAAMLFLAIQFTIVMRANGETRASQDYSIAYEIAAETEEVTQTEPETEPEYLSTIYSRDWDADEARILTKIAMAEAEGESVEGKALVMLVVLNRVWSDDFPNSIREVVFQEGQFAVTEKGGRYWSTEPDEDCYIALTMIENGWDESWGALYFESCEGESWHSRNLRFLFQNGNHKFYQ